MRNFIEVVDNLVTHVVACDADMPSNFIEINTNLPHSEIINMYYVNGQLKHIPPKPSMFHKFNAITETFEYDIESNKYYLAQIISEECANYILAGFISSALGTVHTYPNNERDQVNLSGSILRSTLPNTLPTDVYPFLCMDVNGVWSYQIHTASQIQQVGSDSYSFILAQRVKNATLQAQIQASTTQAELDAIVW